MSMRGANVANQATTNNCGQDRASLDWGESQRLNEPAPTAVPLYPASARSPNRRGRSSRFNVEFEPMACVAPPKFLGDSH